MIERKFGWWPDLPDHRDFKFVPEPEIEIKDHVDLRPGCSAVEDQGDLGECTATATIGVAEFLEIKNGVSPFIEKSSLFEYFNTRYIEGTTREDSGGTLRDSIKAGFDWGICNETLWPRDISKFADKPNLACYRDAAKHKFTAYYRIKSFNDALACLASGYPFVFGFSVYDNFPMESKDGMIPMPQGGMQGGHAVVGVGYSKITRLLIFRNSWSEKWGHDGYGYLPFDYVSSSDLADDFWQVLRQK